MATSADEALNLERAWARDVALRDSLAPLPSLAVAYSGGVDSAYLMHVAADVLGDRVYAVVADSPSMPRAELDEALGLARSRGWRVEVIATRELENPDYASNPVNRCYFCKAELFDRLETWARERGIARLAYGENADDMRDVRPGRKAAAEFAVLAPLRDAGLAKADIRALSYSAGLPTADKPAAPCLASRLPTGRPVTREALAQIEAAEAALHAEGFRIVRVRHHGEIARVQVAPEETPRLLEPETRARVEAKLREVGFGRTEFDTEGYQGPSLL